MPDENVGSARHYREVAEAYLGGRKVEVAGAFQREDPPEDAPELIYGLFDRLYQRLTEGPVGRLPGRFCSQSRATLSMSFAYKQRRSNLEVQSQVAVFDRDDIRLGRTPSGDSLFLNATEKGRTRQITLDGTVVDRNRAAEVLVALSE